MPDTDRHTGGAPPHTLAERLKRERERLFVGRDAERARFQRLIEGEAGARIVVVSGPAGIGKSLLAERLLATARQQHIRTAALDAQLLQEATPRALETLLAEVADPFDPGASINVLCIDNVERIAAMESWLRSTLLTLLPTNTLLVLTGRWQPPTAWRADPALSSILEHWELTPLSADDVADYLQRRGLTSTQRTAVTDFAHGHPLAVALAADHLQRTGEDTLQPDKSGDLIQRLIDWLLSNLENTRYREGLEATATLHFVNEPVLQTLVPQADAGALYRWLATQPYMEHRPRGLLMHELVRTVIIEDLRRRNLPRHHRLIRRAADFYMSDLQHRNADTVHSTVADWAYTVRWEPYMRRYYDMSPPTHYLDEAQNGELEALADIVEAHEGVDARRWFLDWQNKQPDLLFVVRDDVGRPAGLMLGLIFGYNDTGTEQRDPAVDKYLRYLKQYASLEHDEKALLVRFIIATDTYQQTGPAFTQLEMKVNSLAFLPGLIYFAIMCDRTKDWQSSAENANFKALPGCQIKTGYRELEIRGCDLKAEPPLIWIRNTVERMLGNSGRETGHTAVTCDEFTRAVLDAMRHFRNDELLDGNLLLRTHLLNHGRAGCPTVRDLRGLITGALKAIDRQHPGKRLPEVIEHSYFRPDGKQITAAAAMSISESTFRRRLRLAENAVLEYLWKREIRPDRYADGSSDG